MKPTQFVVLPLAYCACLLLASSQVQALDAKREVEDLTQWTQDQVHSYLDKYNIVYDKNVDDQSLLDTVKKYRDAAVITADVFVNDQAEALNRLIEGLKIKLQKNYKLTENDVDALTDNIRHNLKELELRGSLTQEQAKKSLDKLKHDAITKKHLTDAQWKEISADIESAFVAPTWYQRLFGTSHRFPENTFYSWLEKNGIPQRLEKDKNLTKEQVSSIIETLKTSVASATSSVSDLSKLGSADWWAKVSKDIEKNAQLKQGEVKAIADSIKDDIYAYKIFAMDNMEEAVDHSQHVFSKAGKYIKETTNNIYNAIVHPLQSHSQEGDKLHSATSVVSSYASSAASDAANSAASVTSGAGAAVKGATAAVTDATDAASATVSSVQSQVTSNVNEAKDSFGRYWRNQELNAYKKIGYTEAHIDWIENYLSSTFRHRSTVAKETVQQALQNIRQYLISAKVETEARIDAQLKSLERMVESWRKTVRDDREASRDEL